MDIGTDPVATARLHTDPATRLLTVPVLDTRDPSTVAAISELGAVDEIEIDFSATGSERGAWYAQIEARRLQEWQNTARRFAALGVRPSPSHVQSSGGERYVDLNGGLLDAEAFRDELVSSGSLRDDDPLVMLAYHLGPEIRFERIPPLRPGLGWTAVTHQSAGIACHHANFVGVPVRLHDQGAVIARDLSLFCDLAFPDGHSCIGVGGVLLKELARYRHSCDTLGVRAERSWRILEEAISPLDATDTNLDALGTIAGFSGELDELTRPAGHGPVFSENWAFVVFGPNCD
jgi:hypothetical protein